MKTTLATHSIRTTLLVAFALPTVFSACVKKSSRVASTGETLQLGDLVAEGEPVRLALLSEEDEALARSTLAEVKKGKELMPSLAGKERTFTRQVFASLNITAKYAQGIKKNGDVYFRSDIFAIGADIARSELIPLPTGGTLTAPFGLSKGTEIQIGRAFPSEKEAAAADPFDIQKLPLDAERARALKPGESVSVPCTTSIFLNVNGSFLQRNWQRAAGLTKFFQTSMSGSLSAIPEGHLLAQGLFNLHVLRGTGDKVRVKVTTHQSAKAGGKLAITGGVENKYVFLPGTRLAKLKGLKTIKGLKKPDRLIALAHATKVAKDFILPKAFEKLASIQPALAADESLGSGATARLSGQVDSFVEAADKLSTTVDEINAATTDRVNKAVEGFNKNVVAKVKQFTDHTIDAQGSVELGADFARGLRLLADYELDLSTPEGRTAYDRILSGRVVMQARDQAIAPWKMKDQFLADFSYADEIATLDSALPSGAPRRAVRMANVVDSYKRADYELGFKLPKVSRVFNEAWRENDVTIGADGGRDLAYRYKVWEFGDTLTLGGADSERKSSGLLFPTDGAGNATDTGNYFYTWRRSFPAHHTQPLGDSLRQAINVTGPAGFLFGLPARYAGEYPGETSVALTLTFLPGAVTSFFDPKTTTHEILWKAFVSTTSGWLHDDRNRVPMLAGPRADGRLKDQFAKDACNVLQTDFSWGGGYCNFFDQTFLPKWNAAANEPDKTQRVQLQLDLLAHFYSKGFLANKVGGDLLARFVSEVLYAKHGRDYINNVVLNIDYENTDDASEVANPDFSHGEDAASVVVDTLSETFE